MQKYEKVTVVLLIMVVASIAILYMMASPESGLIESGYSDYSDSSNVGDSVTVDAKVLDISSTFTGNNLILTVEPESIRTQIKVFIRSSAGADALSKEISVGDFVIVRGKVAEYEGEREIIVEKKQDVSKKTQ